MDSPEGSDSRSTSELIAAALDGSDEDPRVRDAIWELRRRGGDDVLESGISLLRSAVARERVVGADLLGQLGVPRPAPGLQVRCGDAVLTALDGETDPDVLYALGVALGHLHDPRAVAAAAPLKAHPSPDVRLGVVMAMTPHADPVAVQTLVLLTTDGDRDVRDWATFALGTQLEQVDTPEVREALLARLADPDAEIRGEALVGLARRKDLRVRAPLEQELTGKSVIILAVEAAELLGDPAYLPLLQRLQAAPGTADAYFLQTLADAMDALEKIAPRSKA